MIRLNYHSETIDSVSAPVSLVEFDISSQYGFCYTAEWVGASLTGTLDIQGSNNKSDWYDVGVNADLAAVSRVILNETDTFYRYVRCNLNVTSGSITTITVVFNSKG